MPMPSPAELIRMPLVLQPHASEIHVRRDVVYRDGFLADIYEPGEAGQPRKVVIFVHGGPVPADKTQPKEWRIFTDYGRLAAASGFTGVTFNHGLFSPGHYARARSNVEAVIDHVRRDGDQMFLWAFSGGGPLLRAGFDPARKYIRGLISYYAALDDVVPGKSTPPMFIARAGADFEGINLALDRFLDVAFANGVELELMNHAAGEHGFDILNDDERSREIIRQTIDFIRRR